MHILLITHRFLPRFVGGVEFYTLRLAKALQALDCQVHILTGEPIAKADLTVETVEETYDGLPVTRLLYDYARRPVSQPEARALSRATASDAMLAAL